ncbi:MAG TPA: methionine--tRNA ligase subunit beta, partial [Kofleriaceae bacterium]|nr:methionine--tRNA ligase subunit beta [Kofleriaceae bacterium]
RYQEPLLQHFERNPGFVQPEGHRNELVSFVKRGLRDLSISRTTFRWGVPVPGDEEHVIYVWIDALTNYMSALGPIDGELHRRYWPATCHLIGKDIIRFHAVYWPCMLLSAGLPLPETVFSHGWWTVRGEKISKSMPATRVDPNRLADDIGVDAVRYYLLREVPLGLDGDFAYENLIGRYNAELAHDLGNLVSRALTVAQKFAGGTLPAIQAPRREGAHIEITEVAHRTIAEAAAHYRGYAPSRALEAIWRLVGEANRYINNTQPWTMAKSAARAEELEHTIRTALEAILCVARMLAPVMPKTAADIAELVGGAADMTRTWPAPERFGRELAPGARVGESRILFPRIDEEKQAALLDRWIPADARAAEPSAPARTPAAGPAKKAKPKAKSSAPVAGPVTFEDFGRMDLRVAQVLSAEAIPGATKLLRLMLDAGEPEPRQVVAGIAEAYQPGDLVGRKVIFLANLEPAAIRGVTSQGMILAAGEKGVVGLSALDRDVPVGTKVR